MKIYLDIDGVLLKKDLSVPDYGKEFIDFLTANFDCYWLTTHCRGGENNTTKYLSAFYAATEVKKLETLKRTEWTDLKTEAIDLGEEFLWLEDYPFEAEKRVLEASGKIDSLIIVDLKIEGELKIIREKIEKIRRRK